MKLQCFFPFGKMGCYIGKVVPAISAMMVMSGQLSAELPQSRNFELQRLADGIYAAIHVIGGHAICNAGIIDLGDETLIFDTFLSPVAARELLTAAKQLNLSPVAYVVNSHWHNDHIRGNGVFGNDVTIVSTELTRELIMENEPQQIAREREYAKDALVKMDSLMRVEEDPSKKQTYLMWHGYYKAMVESHSMLKSRVPNLTFDQELVIHGSKRTAQLICHGKGHTESDLILCLPGEKIVFAADLVFVGVHPYMADGDPDHWKEYLKKIQDLDIETVVPGHGSVGNAKALSVMAQYIETVENLAKEMMDEGADKSEIDSVPIPKPFDTWSFESFFRMNMRFLCERIRNRTVDKKTDEE